MRMRWSHLLATGLAVAGLLMMNGNAWTEDEHTPGAGTASALSGHEPMGTAGEQHKPLVFGRVSAIDTWDQTVTVQGFLLDKTLKVVSGTEIGVEDKTVARLDDLKIGDRVQILYHKKGKLLIADRITDTSWNNTQHGGSSGGGSGAY